MPLCLLGSSPTWRKTLTLVICWENVTEDSGWPFGLENVWSSTLKVKWSYPSAGGVQLGLVM